MTKFPGKAWEHVHSVFKHVPLNHVVFFIVIWDPNVDDGINESSLKDNALVMFWDKFLFVYSIVESCIWGCFLEFPLWFHSAV